MIRKLDEFLEADRRLEALYGGPPAVGEVTVRSFRLVEAGPSVYLRVDFPVFPALAPSEWVEAGCDRFQVGLEFIWVRDLVISSASLPSQAIISGESEEGVPVESARFRVDGDGIRAEFSAYGRVRTGSYSGYRHPSGGDGVSGPAVHYYLSRVSAKLYTTIPEPWKESFHERL